MGSPRVPSARPGATTGSSTTGQGMDCVPSPRTEAPRRLSCQARLRPSPSCCRDRACCSTPAGIRGPPFRPTARLSCARSTTATRSFSRRARAPVTCRRVISSSPARPASSPRRWILRHGGCRRSRSSWPLKWRCSAATRSTTSLEPARSFASRAARQTIRFPCCAGSGQPAPLRPWARLLASTPTRVFLRTAAGLPCTCRTSRTTCGPWTSSATR